MRYLYVCNTSSDYISKVNTETFTEDHKIVLSCDISKRVGPHGISVYNDTLVVANCYSNSISLIDMKSNEEIDNYFIGIHCNDVAVCDNYAYIVCGEINNVIAFDLIKNKVVEQIPCGNYPHSITVDEKNKVLLISNMESDSITLIDCNDLEQIKNIRVGFYPTKAIFTYDSNNIIVCESNLGSDYKGTISIVSPKNNRIISRVEVGYSPVDIYYSKGECYVSNFGDSTINIVNIASCNVLKKVKVGGMPRGIIKFDKKIYIGDNYKNLLLQVDDTLENKKIIPIGGEPTGMILV